MLPSLCFEYITWKLINHWFLEIGTLMWTARLFCVSFLSFFFFYEAISCTAKKLTQEAHERTAKFSVHKYKLNIRKPLEFTELQLATFLMESPIVFRVLIRDLESYGKVGFMLLSQFADTTVFISHWHKMLLC